MTTADQIAATSKAAVTSDFSVFYSHPFHGRGNYTVASISAQQAGKEAADMLPEDFSDEENPEDIDLDIIRDELEIRVYAGHLDTEPTGRTPDWVFE